MTSGQEDFDLLDIYIYNSGQFGIELC